MTFFHVGKVIHGTHEGTTLGFPTANLEPTPEPRDLAPGVYAAQTQYQNKTFPSLVYFGPRLTHGETKNNFEVHLFDFSQDLYGQQLEVSLVALIRPPISFSSSREFLDQLDNDVSTARTLLAIDGSN